MKSVKVLLLVMLCLGGTIVSWADGFEQQALRVCSFGQSIPETEIKFTVATVLQSNMVVQQGKPFSMWGTAPAGDTITLSVDWNNSPVQVVADASGRWEGQVPVPAVKPGDFSAHTITVSCEKDSLTLSNILIGEVWLCSGQSNMDMEMKPALPWLRGVLDYEKEIASADFPAIRLINIENNFKKTPQQNAKGTWLVCSPQTAGDFSGVAYFYGRELLQKLQVPIGLVVSSVGGSACQGWTSREALESDPEVKAKYLTPYDLNPQAQESLDSIKTLEKLFEVLARPTLLYNAMIHPLKDFSIRGFLWYQGESNKKDGSAYTRLCTAMVKGWRKDFNQGDLPFYYVQVTPYNWEEKDSMATYHAKLREAQDAMLQVKNTGMAVTMDIGEVNDIHPRNKKDVGLRLARIALAKTYDQPDVVYVGPRLEKVKVKGKKVIVSFLPQSLGTGLTTSDGQTPKYFYVAGEDKIFYPAEASIYKDQVLLSSEKVKKPVAIRYAFTNYPITNFGNKEGLPAMPFRTDTWEE
ncbi:sialate O-acetylesterase [Rufibacter latericius]|uniref:Sialate O-acetylesterase n=1 Tax=Rufibacter latericius TaxID=2487040 RepID=A0A3M9MCW7_9BACT|nr:sialate O-acetylesterase [Rufibacter latericius]RNI22673.1 sialate O-acetylesterase [Rufibacter latericius]